MNQVSALPTNPACSEASRSGILARVEAQVRHDPDAIAVTCGEDCISYAELDSRANRVAHHLLALGVGRDTCVGLCMTRSIELIVGMLGIVKAGAAYLPMDLAYPRDRLAFMLEDAEAAVVLTLSRDRDAIPDTAASVVCLDSDWPHIAAGSSLSPGVDHGPASLAYVIYTSGSTGKPKGCQVTHGNVAWFFQASDRRFDFMRDDTWAFVLSQAFDVSGFEIWGALSHGARLVVVSHETARAPDALRELLLRERVTVLCNTPTAFGQLMRADEVDDRPSDYALRYVILGGEALELQSLRPWIERYGDRHPQLVNMYGPTETTIYVTSRVISLGDLDRGAGSVIGTGLPGVVLHVLDENLVPVSAGTEGELCVGGAAVTLGYLKRPEATAAQFISWQDPRLTTGEEQRLYRTGDVVRELADGDFEYLGRRDHQVKFHGFRIELGEIEATMARHPAIRACVVLAREDRPGDRRLVAYVVADGQLPPVDELRAHLARTLPEFMLPSAFVALDRFPQNDNGKLDRHALPPPDRRRPELSVSYEPPRNRSEQAWCDAFADTLDIDRVGRHDNFFELGGNSLLAARLLARIDGGRGGEGGETRGTGPVPITRLFQHPTPAGLAAVMADDEDESTLRARMPRAQRGEPVARDLDDPIAIVAMAGRFPGAGDVEKFWSNLCEGVDSITRFRAEELDPAIRPSMRNDPAYVAARGVIDGVEDFDAAFFGISHKEAELTDPQHRIFLELCWECLERGGHVPDDAGVPVGVFAGMHDGTYLQRHLLPRADLVDQAGALTVSFLNEKDYFATRVAHKLNLTGPVVNVQTACSTSLVAICQAVDSLRAGHCDMALAGGASVTCPPRSGYLYEEGAIFSRDGRTRSFDREAQGTVFSDGAMVVLLKRLSDARADGNPVHAVIRGCAVNNDGGGKASFTAPSSEGQAAVIAMAHRDARVDARSIGYVEAHGTGTPVGDPIEIEGLTKAFRLGTADTGFCRIGSLKSNVGHLVIAAGGAGLIKAALSLQERVIPPSLHFDSPNPAIDFAGSPFVVNARLSQWPGDGAPRRAGVSSFGIGGTNAHVVLEQAPPAPPSDLARGPQLLVLSARNQGALRDACSRLADHLEAEPEANLADVAWTLAVGRKAFSHRLALVVEDLDKAVAALRSAASAAARTRPAHHGGVVFLFPGQGATYPGMGRELYATEHAFRAAIDECAQILRRADIGSTREFDIREHLFSDAPEALLPTSIMQRATFVLEYALARWWMALGLIPVAMIGHSVGEFVAATLAGVFSLPDGLRLVAQRGSLMQAQPAGAMLAVRLSAQDLRARLPDDLSLAAENAPEACVVSGAHAAISRFQDELERDGIACRALRTSHAFHSPMMEPVVAPFRAEVAAVELSAPTLPLVSTATGDWLDPATATSAEYWAQHLRVPVRFSTALDRVLDSPSRVLLEVGPRGTLSALAREQPRMREQGIVAIASLDDEPGSETASVRLAAGRLWSQGVALDPCVFDRREHRQRIRLPTYPFQRQRFWVDATIPEPWLAQSPTRAALPVEHAVCALQADDAGPEEAVDPRVRYLIDVWSELLGGPVAGDDNFFELGGHSMLAVQMVNRVDRETGVRIKLIRLGAENLAQLAATLPEPKTIAPPASAPAGMGGRFGHRLKRLLGIAASDPGP